MMGLPFEGMDTLHPTLELCGCTYGRVLRVVT